VEVHHQALVPQSPVPFPFSSVHETIHMMVKTLFRVRMPIRPLPKELWGGHDLVVLAGPTWSYNPCGPILSFLDLYGHDAMSGKLVLPVISCRGYWRLHWRYLKKKIAQCGGIPLAPWVFTHPAKEPWRTMGVFLTVAGEHPKRFPILRDHYPRYGHDRGQLEKAKEMASAIPSALDNLIKNDCAVVL